jgi:putative aldouronate transport system substrate-binding protein
MKKARILALITALLMLVMIPTGCTTTTTQPTVAPTDAPATTAASQSAAESASVAPTATAAADADDGSLVEMVIVNSNGSNTLLDLTVGQLQVEKRWNVKLKAIRLSSDTANEKLGALFASGEKMDIIKTGDMASLVAQGVLGEISTDMMQTYMPKTWARAQKAVSDNGITNVADLLSVSGKIYAFPYIQESTKRNEWLRAFRQDILKEVGWDKPPQTIDDYDKVFALVKAKYPNMYMMGGMGKDIYEFFAPEIMGAYTQEFNTWMMLDGKVVNSCVAPAAKDYLTKMAEWYKKGYIDPEWFTDNWDTVFNKFAQGKLFTVIDHSGDINIMPDEYKEYQPQNEVMKLRANFPNATMIWAAPVTGPTGRKGNVRPLAVIPGAMVTKEFAANKVGIIRYMKMVEGMSYDLQDVLDWMGVEGTNYSLSGDSAAPMLTWINGFDVAAKQQTVYPYPFYSHAFIPGENAPDSSTANLTNTAVTTWSLTTWRQAQGYSAFDTSDYIQISVPTVGSMPPEIVKIGNENPDNILKEYYDAILLGTKPISAFDEMVTKWYANGGKERTDWMNANAIKLSK